MKRLLLILTLIFLVVGCSDSEIGSEQQGDQDFIDNNAKLEEGYRYVSVIGSIETAQNEEIMAGFVGIAFDYAANYSIELWFPIEGGKAVQQRNTITLTEFRDLYYGNSGCPPCDWNLDASSFEALPFELEASLNLGILEVGGRTADELVYELTVIPQKAITGIVQCTCGDPDDFFDPAAFPVLLSWFMQKLVNPIFLNELVSNTVENNMIYPAVIINIPEEKVSYRIVPSLDVP